MEMSMEVRIAITTVSGLCIILIPWIYARWLQRDIRRRLASLSDAAIEGHHKTLLIGIGGSMMRSAADVLQSLHLHEQDRDRPLFGEASAWVTTKRQQQLQSRPTVVAVAALQEGAGEGEGLVRIKSTVIPTANATPVAVGGDVGVGVGVGVVIATPIVAAQPVLHNDNNPNHGDDHHGQEVDASLEATILAASHVRLLACYHWTRTLTFVIWSLIYGIIDIPSLWSSIDIPHHVAGMHSLSLPWIDTFNAMIWLLPPLFATTIVTHSLMDIDNLVTDSQRTVWVLIGHYDIPVALCTIWWVCYYWDLSHSCIYGIWSVMSEDSAMSLLSFILFTFFFLLYLLANQCVVHRCTDNGEDHTEKELSRTLGYDLLAMAQTMDCNGIPFEPDGDNDSDDDAEPGREGANNDEKKEEEEEEVVLHLRDQRDVDYERQLDERHGVEDKRLKRKQARLRWHPLKYEPRRPQDESCDGQCCFEFLGVDASSSDLCFAGGGAYRGNSYRHAHLHRLNSRAQAKNRQRRCCCCCCPPSPWISCLWSGTWIRFSILSRLNYSPRVATQVGGGHLRITLATVRHMTSNRNQHHHNNNDNDDDDDDDHDGDDMLRTAVARELIHIRAAHGRRLTMMWIVAIATVIALSMAVPYLLTLNHVVTCNPGSSGSGGSSNGTEPVPDCTETFAWQINPWRIVITTMRWSPLVWSIVFTLITWLIRWKQRGYEYQADIGALEIMGGNVDIVMSSIALLHDASRLPVAHRSWFAAMPPFTNRVAYIMRKAQRPQ